MLSSVLPDEWHITHYECSGEDTFTPNPTQWQNTTSIPFTWSRVMDQVALAITSGVSDTFINASRFYAPASMDNAAAYAAPGDTIQVLYQATPTSALATVEVVGSTFRFFKQVGNSTLFDGFNNGDSIGWNAGPAFSYKAG